MSIREFAEKFIKAQDEAWQNGNFDPLEALENSNVIYHRLGRNEEVSGWEAHKQYILTARQAISNLQQEWKFLTGEGNYFALTYEMRGLFTGEIPGFPPPTGKEVTANSLFFFRLQNGKIAEAWANGSNTGLVNSPERNLT